MTAYRRGWALRTAVVAAMAAALLTGVAAPAYADHDVRLGGINNIELRVGGGTQNIEIRVENRNGGNHTSPDGVARNVQLTLTVPGDIGVVIASAPNGCGLSGNNTRMDCAVAQIAPDQTFTGIVQIGVNGNDPVAPGENQDGTARVQLNNGQSQQFNVRVQGRDRPPSVAEVTGTVVDQNTGQPIENAKVTLADSQGATFETTTNAQGQFSFAGQEIAEGQIGLLASKDGYQSPDQSLHNGVAGQPLGDIRLVLINTATPTASAPATTAPPTATPTASAAPAAVPTSSGGSFFTTLMVVLGVLLVALGIGAIVLLVIRQRRRAREEGEDDGLAGADDPISGPRGPGPAPGSRGVYRPTPTQVAGAGAARTQVMGPGGAVPAVGPSPALANAPTMLQRGAAGAAGETAMLPRAGAPAGPRPAVPGGPGSPGAPTLPGVAGAPPGPGSPGAPPVPGGRGAASVPRPGSPQPTTYGAAAPAGPYDRGGYEGRRGGYDEGRGGYAGSPSGYGSPAAPDAGRGGYGDAADRTYGGYDQPTGRHEPAPPAGYEPAGYEPDRSYRSDSYGPDPYTPRSSSGGGYGGSRHQSYQDGYSDEGNSGSGYESRAHDRGQGYDRGGYDRGGYESRGYEGQGYEGQGYEGQGYEGQGYDDRGYGQPSAGGGHRGSEYGRQAPEAGGYETDHDESRGRSRHSQPTEPAERRRLDWLD